MSMNRKHKMSSDDNPGLYKKIKKEILLCGHASWTNDVGFTAIPKDTYLYMYAPLGSALSQAIPKAIASGEKIIKGDLTIKRISPIMLFNLGYADRGKHAGNYKSRDKEMMDYPILLGPGEKVPNYSMSSPEEDFLTATEKSNILVRNIKAKISLENLLKAEKGNVCHFGGCSWIREENDKRDLVIFKDERREDKFKIKLSNEEIRAKREERFKK